MYGPWVRVPAGSLKEFHFTSESLEINDFQGFFVSTASVYLASPCNLIHHCFTETFDVSPKFQSMKASIIFFPTLLKLFSFDIQNIPPAGKIAAFILLGVLLLTVSFINAVTGSAFIRNFIRSHTIANDETPQMAGL
jgi:hypothetical protein